MRLEGIVIISIFSYALGIDGIYYLFTRDNPKVPQTIKDETQLNTKKPLKFLVHGYLGTTLIQDYAEMRDGFLANEDCNVVVFDWTMNNAEYSRTQLNVKLLGSMLGSQICYVFDHYDHIHLIGTGLGAHLAGFAGKEVIKCTGGKGQLRRISGLDPTLPKYNGTLPSERLDKDDALMVDVYHCDGNRLGFMDPIGDVDFYVNGGVGPQPNCNDASKTLMDFFYSSMEDITCSHISCRAFFLQTVTNTSIFATKCESSRNFTAGLCDKNEKIVFGNGMNLEARGSYYLNMTLYE